MREASHSMKRIVEKGFSHHWTNEALTRALCYALRWAAKEVRRRDADALAHRFEAAADILEESDG